jgi:hypothetical protein
MHSKGNHSLKRASSKKRKTEYLLSTEISLTTSSDEDTCEKYLFDSSKPISSRKKISKQKHLNPLVSAKMI